jgi:hypothetical protein
MSQRERLRRDDPSRIAPMRDFSHLYRPPGVSDGQRSLQELPLEQKSQQTNSLPPATGVEAAYRVIQKHLDEGRREAEQLTNGSRPAASASDPLQHLLERTLRFQEEILPLVLDSLRNWVKVPAAAVTGPGSQDNSSAHVPLNSGSVVVEVVSIRPVEVSLDVRDHSQGLSLATPGLYALDGGKPALTDVSFTPAVESRGRIRVRVVIPDDQPPGNYSGAVMDLNSSEAFGILSVSIKDPPHGRC